MRNHAQGDSPIFRSYMRLKAVVMVSALMLMLLTSGCATVGKDFADTYVPDIKIGKTTQQEIRVMFGSPWRIGMEDSLRTWTYGNYKYSLFNEKKAKDLVIRFNDKNVVQSYTFSTTEHYE